MCQDISTDVADFLYIFTQVNPPPPGGKGSRGGQGGGGRGSRGGQGGDPKQVSVPGNCNQCGIVGHCVRDCPKRNTYCYSPYADTEETANKVHFKKLAKSYVTMSYYFVCKRWDYHHAPGHDDGQDVHGGASGNGDHNAATVAAVGDGDDLDDEFIPFIG